MTSAYRASSAEVRKERYFGTQLDTAHESQAASRGRSYSYQDNGLGVEFAACLSAESRTLSKGDVCRGVRYGDQDAGEALRTTAGYSRRLDK